jgi:hypothetical protein
MACNFQSLQRMPPGQAKHQHQCQQKKHAAQHTFGSVGIGEINEARYFFICMHTVVPIFVAAPDLRTDISSYSLAATIFSSTVIRSFWSDPRRNLSTSPGDNGALNLKTLSFR